MQQVIKKQQQVQILPLPTLGISYSRPLPPRQQLLTPPKNGYLLSDRSRGALKILDPSSSSQIHLWS